MPLEIKIKQSLDAANRGAVTVELAGSLDTATAPELERQTCTHTGYRCNGFDI